MEEVKKVLITKSQTMKIIQPKNKSILIIIIIITLLSSSLSNTTEKEQTKSQTQNTLAKKNQNQISLKENFPPLKTRHLNDDSPPALTCSGSCNGCTTSSSNCNACSSGYYPLQGSAFPTNCYSSPQNGRFINSSSKWEICSSNCNTCSGTAFNCYSCKSNWSKINSASWPTTCYDNSSPPRNFYLINNNIISGFFPCNPACATCQDGIKCLTCETNYFKISTAAFPTECYKSDSAPAGYCYSNSDFKFCDVSCSSTTDCLTTNCTQCKTACKESYYLKKDTAFPNLCYNSIPGYFLKDNFWEICDGSCGNCVTESTNCLNCQTNYYIKYGTSFPTKCYGTTLTESSYFLSGNQWNECNNNCKNCVLNEFNCTSCNAGKYIKFGTHNPNICMEKIEQYFLNSADSLFHPCDASCNNCIDNKLKCEACAPNYFEEINKTFPTECYKTPYDGYFLKENKWHKCDISCSTCVTEATKCLICANNYFGKIGENFPTECFTFPLNSWFLNSTKWERCDITSCGNCVTNSTNCTNCADGYYKKLGENFPTLCHKCGISCKKCVDSEEKCTECTSKFYRKNTENFPVNCYDKLVGWYVNEELYKICDKSCHDCITTDINCLSCANTYIFLEDKKNCFIQAPTGYYLNTSYNLHKSCDVSCFSCTDIKVCTKCAENYFPLVDIRTKCFNKALVSYTDDVTKVSYFSNEVSKDYEKCAENCKICKLKNDHCVLCNYEANYFHIEDKVETCLNVCPEFYFRNYLKKECSKCHVSCKTCADSSKKCFVIFF